MRRNRIPTEPALAMVLVAVALAGPAGAGSDEGGCRPWRLVPFPPDNGSLQVVSGTSSDDMWAVGELLEPKIRHWDGTEWSAPPQDDLGKDDKLYDVGATSHDDAWAAGSQNSGRDPLAMHWDGAMWSIVRTPSPGETHHLYGLDLVASNDVWAVGSFTTATDLWPLALHWDGTRWRKVKTVDPAPYSELFYGISALASDDVWAVGRQEVEPFTYQSLAARWDGTSWAVVETAAPPAGNSAFFYEISALSSTDAWAVGWYGDPFLPRPMTQHWDGTAWTLVPTPAFGGSTSLYGVEAIAPDDVWAVGAFGTLDGEDQAVTLHWDGIAWTEFRAPNPGNAGLLSVSAVSPTEIWAAGGYDLGQLVLRTRGPCG